MSSAVTRLGAALVVEDLAVRYGGVSAVRSVSFTVAPGQSVGLIGANGAGKTSTLRALMGLVPRAGGTVRFGSHDLSRVPARNMVRLGIGYVPEGRRVFAGLTVEKNLLLGAYARRWDAATRETLGEVYELFPVLAEMRGRLAGALSGGQQQMLAIGRALMARPVLLLLDEPSMGLSPKLVEVIGVDPAAAARRRAQLAAGRAERDADVRGDQPLPGPGERRDRPDRHLGRTARQPPHPEVVPRPVNRR